MLTFAYSYDWQKLNNKMNKKGSQEYLVWSLNMWLDKLIVIFWSFFWDN